MTQIYGIIPFPLLKSNGNSQSGICGLLFPRHSNGAEIADPLKDSEVLSLSAATENRVTDSIYRYLKYYMLQLIGSVLGR